MTRSNKVFDPRVRCFLPSRPPIRFYHPTTDLPERQMPMNGRNPSIFSCLNSRSAKGSRRSGHRDNDVALLFALGIVACFWAARPCVGQIQNDAYISNFGSNNVTVLDTFSATLVSTIPLTPDLGPVGVAVTPDGRFAYITNAGAGAVGGTTVSVIDVPTNTVFTTITVGASPEGVAVTPDAHFAYVTNLVGGTVSVINTTTNAVTDTITVAGATALQGVAITPDGKFAYVTNRVAAQNNVSVINTANNTVVGTLSVGSLPAGIAISPNGQFAYTANFGSNTVSVIDTATNTVVDTINTTAVQPLGIAVTPDGKFVYVTSGEMGGATTVSVIDTTSNVIVQNIVIPMSVGSQPAGVSFTPNGAFAFVSNFETISEIDTATHMVVQTITAGTSPVAFGSFIGPNIIAAQGGPLLIANDAALTALGFGTFVDFNGGTLQTTGSLVTSRTISLLASGGTIDSNGFDSLLSGDIINAGSLTKIGAGTLTLSGNNSYGGGTNILGGAISVSSDTNLGTGDLSIGNHGELLTTGATFTTGKTITLGTSGGTLASANGTTAIYGGVISGSGPLTIGDGINLGTIVLNALNTYSGGTTINAGILEVGADVNLGSTSGGLAFNGGTLQTLASFTTARATTLNAAGGTFEPSAGTTFTAAGTISGVGGLTKTGPGTVILGGNNSYTGGTTVVAGTLQAGSPVGFVSNTAYTVIGGTLDLNNFNLTMSSLNGTGGVVNLGSAALTINDIGKDAYSGIIQGIGSLTKVGAGTLTLSGNNNYTGGTTVVAGTLQAGSPGGLVSNTAYTVFGGTLDLNNFNLTMSSLNGSGGIVRLGSAALTVNNTGTDVYSGVIQGSGSLTKLGPGTLTLSGNNSYSGGTLLKAGTLVINSAQALGLGNVVVNGGVLRADPQPINVNGNYTQNTGGTLQLSLGGSRPGQYDSLVVSGRATLDGTLQLVALSGFQPKIGDKLSLVLAAGGVSGQFANVVDPFSSLTGLELVYLPDVVVLEFGSDFRAFAQTPNQLAVATQLDAVAFDPRETHLISFLQNEPLGNLAADFEKISPDSLSALYEISFSAANIQAANLENRFAEIRNGSTGFTSSLTMSNSPGTMVEGKDGKAVIEPSKNLLTPSPENKWGVWIAGSGDFVNVSGDGNGQGYDFSTGGVSLGLDYRLTRNLAVGIAVGYAHTWTDLTGNGNIDANSGRGGLYATFSEGGFYLNGYAGGGYNSYDTQRNALQGDANGNTNGGEFDGYAGGGYDFHCGGFTFGPIASLQYTYVSISGYNESGSLAPLRIVSQNQDSMRTNLGLSASYTWKAGKVQLRPILRASWQHEYLYSALPIEAQFASGAGSVFTVHGPAEGHDSALIDAGFDVQWTPAMGTYFGYNGSVGRDNYDSNSVICSVHVDF
jgi:outer membrane autotransporter protein